MMYGKNCLEKKEINIISNRCTRVIIQKVDIEISKDKYLLIRDNWIR